MLVPVKDLAREGQQQQQSVTPVLHQPLLLQQLKPPFARCSITDQEVRKNHPQCTKKIWKMMTSCMVFLILSTWRGHAELFKHSNTSSTRWPTIGIDTRQNISWRKKDYKPGHPVLFKLHEDKNGKDKHLSSRRAAAGNLENGKSSSEPNETTSQLCLWTESQFVIVQQEFVVC